MIVQTAVVGDHTVSASFRTPRGTSVVRWVLPGDPGIHSDDAVLVSALLPAMAAGEPLTIEPPISARLLAKIATIQDVFESWSRDKELTRGQPPVFRRVPVQATTRPAIPPVAGAGCAAFFTGGVDSFYTALKRRDELTALVFVHGFDVPLHATVLRAQVSEGLRRAADALGLPLFEVETNVRELSDPTVQWLDYHGAALAGVALLLAPWFQKVYVPATMTYATLDPLGSHPLVDPLWSTEEVEIVHDGCEATRLEKLRTIAACDAARTWLRVCPKNGRGTYNCGSCEKCLRTMVAVRLVDAPERFASLPLLDDQALARIARVDIPGNGATWELLFHTANRRNDRALVHALRLALRRRRVRTLGRAVVRPVRTMALR